MRRHELSDEEWAVIQPLLPNKPRGVPRVDDRRVINGILWRFRTGAPWRDIPERYGPRTTLYNRFTRWRAVGVWDRLLAAVSEAYEGRLVMIDSSCVRVHQHGAAPKDTDSCVGRSRGGLSSKVHAMVDVKGRPVHLTLTAGQRADAPVGAELAEKVDYGATLLADKAYDTNAIRAALNDKKGWANIPTKANRKETFAFSGWLYKYRNRVERFFGKIKQFRGLATRYDRKPENYMAALKLACVRIWLKN